VRREIEASIQDPNKTLKVFAPMSSLLRGYAQR